MSYKCVICDSIMREYSKLDAWFCDNKLCYRYGLLSVPGLSGVTINISKNKVESVKVHPIQMKIYALSEKEDIGKMTLREIGKRIGVDHPQQIDHHLKQLRKKGYLHENK